MNWDLFKGALSVSVPRMDFASKMLPITMNLPCTASNTYTHTQCQKHKVANIRHRVNKTDIERNEYDETLQMLAGKKKPGK